VAAALEAATYPRWRSWCLTWGATDGEAAQALAGDELLAYPAVMPTRAVWVAQARGGAYTYDWIENLLGLGMRSADEVLLQYQDLKVGDAWRLGGRGPVLRVAQLEPERSMVMRSDDGKWVWVFEVVPDGTGSRLISRNRIATRDASRLARALNTYVMEPGSLIVERKMLLGIKQRAERLARAPR